MERKLRLEKGPAAFHFSLDGEDKTIILMWVAETSAPNLVWMRLITIKWRWPPVKCVTAFTDAEALLYMYPRSLEAPMGHDWSQIYIDLGSKVCGSMAREVPEDLKVQC